MKIIMPAETMINIFRIKLLQISCFIVGIMFPAMIHAQNDFESWNGIDVRYDYSKELSFELSNELRFNNNASSFRKYQVDIGANYEIKKFLDVSLFYRYSRFDDVEAFVNEHLIYGKLAFSYKLDRFNFELQTRYDQSYEVYGLSTLVKSAGTWRNKATVSYNIYGLPLEPYLNYEYFISEKKEIFEASKYRLFGGVKYKMNHNHSFAISYGTQQSLVKGGNSYILGLKYGYRF